MCGPTQAARRHAVVGMTIASTTNGAQDVGNSSARAQVRPRIVVDVSNVCLAERDHHSRARLQNLMGVRTLLKELAFEITMICDANLKYSIDDPEGLQQLFARGEVLQVPAGTDADVYILDAAGQLGARVLSNDVYRNYQGRFPWIVERRVAFMVIKGSVLIPDLAVFPVRPLQGVEQPSEDSHRASPTSTSAADRHHSLVRGLVAEVDALRTQRGQLLAECDDLRAQLQDAAATTAAATAACAATQSRIADLEVRTRDLVDELSNVHLQLSDEGQAIATALAEKHELELEVTRLQQRDLSLSARAETLEHALDTMRPDAKLEQRVDKLLRETLRALKSQSEPINHALQQAVETRKAVSAIQNDTRALAQHAEAISSHLARRDGSDERTPDEAWSTRFPRVERAWLAGQLVGDQSECACFMSAVQALRRVDRNLDDDRLLAEVDALASQVGTGFTYRASGQQYGKCTNRRSTAVCC